MNKLHPVQLGLVTITTDEQEHLATVLLVNEKIVLISTYPDKIYARTAAQNLGKVFSTQPCEVNIVMDKADVHGASDEALKQQILVCEDYQVAIAAKQDGLVGAAVKSVAGIPFSININGNFINVGSEHAAIDLLNASVEH